MSQIELCYTFTVPKWTVNKGRACRFIVPFQCYCANCMLSKAISCVGGIMMLEMGKTYWVQGKWVRSWEKKHLREWEWWNDYRGRRKSAKPQRWVGHRSLLKFHSARLVTLILCKVKNNASADIGENNGIMHYSTNESNNTNYSSMQVL